jgi:hypothetical protein
MGTISAASDIISGICELQHLLPAESYWEARLRPPCASGWRWLQRCDVDIKMKLSAGATARGFAKEYGVSHPTISKAAADTA